MSSVNTTYFEESGEHVGTNTDWLGVRNALLSALTGQRSPFPAETPTKFAEGVGAGFVVGAGGATRASVLPRCLESRLKNILEPYTPYTR